jgi:hypothetical protein
MDASRSLSLIINGPYQNPIATSPPMTPAAAPARGREQCSRNGDLPNIHDFRSYFLHLLTGPAGERTNFAALLYLLDNLKKPAASVGFTITR